MTEHGKKTLKKILRYLLIAIFSITDDDRYTARDIVSDEIGNL